MTDALSTLSEYVEQLPPTAEMKAASQKADPFHQRLCQLTGEQEADDIWFAALNVSGAESSAAFRRGFAMGFQLSEELRAVPLTR